MRSLIFSSVKKKVFTSLNCDMPSQEMWIDEFDRWNLAEVLLFTYIKNNSNSKVY